jgi:hypothetical protein
MPVLAELAARHLRAAREGLQQPAAQADTLTQEAW